MADKQPIGRIAMRHEGPNWNAYYAPPDTMEGAVFMGSIPMRFVLNPVRKQAFLDLMRECFADICEEQFGSRPQWAGPVAAPDHERTRQ